jgi:valine dehydrogenase (NAD+)
MKGPFNVFDGHEQVLYGSDRETGLRCIIAIHSTRLGPALGGTRFYPYDSEEDALLDVLRLSKSMTYKAAVAGLDLGGGKAVIIGDPATDKTEALLRGYGRMVASLGGRYITACDVGTYPDDMSTIHRETRWVTGTDVEEGGSGDSGVTTALGTWVGLKACAQHVWGEATLEGRHVAIQGVGKVGRRLAEHLHDEGAHLTVADVNEAAVAWCVEHLGADTAPVDKVHAVDADIFSPNALGGVLDERRVAELTCRVVAGAANNQLVDPSAGEALAEAGILYAPDYVINSGGLIQVFDELRPGGYSETRTHRRARVIGDRLLEVFTVAAAEGLTPLDAAARVAERRIAAVSHVQQLRLPAQ